MLHEKSCGAVLFTTEKGIKKFLLVESNYFGFPKGHVEENETEQETALREIKEETGVDATINPGFQGNGQLQAAERKRQGGCFLYCGVRAAAVHGQQNRAAGNHLADL